MINHPMSSPHVAPMQRNFFRKLFDFGFREFITPSVVRVIFGIYVVIFGLVCLVGFVALARSGSLGVVLGLIVCPLAFTLYCLVGRVFAELSLILFKIEENTRPRG